MSAVTHDYADPYAVRCPTCCAPPLPERDDRTAGFAHASWCRHAPRPERKPVPMADPPEFSHRHTVDCAADDCPAFIHVDAKHADNLAGVWRCHEHAK